MGLSFILLIAIALFPAKDQLFLQTPVSTSNTPFYTEQYKYGDIIMNRGRKFQGVQLKIDLFTNSTQFVSVNGIEIALDPGVVKEIAYADTTSEGIVFYKFRTGFPAIDGKSNQNFYIVLVDGNCSLLRSVEKKVNERKNDASGKLIREYENYEFFYLYKKGEMKRLRRDKDFLLSELSDKQPQLEKFIEDNKLNLRSIEQIGKLLNYYNTL
jgi:hypothetical protein